MDYREQLRVAGLSRKHVAVLMSLSYQALNQRLCGFQRFQPHEEKQLQSIISAALSRRDPTAAGGIVPLSGATAGRLARAGGMRPLG